MDILHEIVTTNISEEELYLAIRERVATMLETQPELLMSYLYRLDIQEERIKGVFSSGVDAIDGISHLILERQKERVASKLKYSQKPIDGWDW